MLILNLLVTIYDKTCCVDRGAARLVVAACMCIMTHPAYGTAEEWVPHIAPFTVSLPS